ncbi:MAG TPA: hypothetical protein VGL28_11015 [Steroidobacteraceae bacterium]|jgi:hypothetical protein
MTASRSPRPPVNVANLLTVATRLFWVTLLKCLPLAMFGVLCLQVPNFYWLASGHSLEHGFVPDRNYLLISMAAVAVMLYFISAMMLRQRAFASGAALDSWTELRFATQRLPAILLGWILAQLSLFVGFTLLIVPGIFLFVCYLAMLPVLLFEQPNPYLALVRCVQLVRPHWWQVFAAFVIALLATLICALLAAAVLSIFAALLLTDGSAVRAIVTAVEIGLGAMMCVFASALALTIHSAASSSA